MDAYTHAHLDAYPDEDVYTNADTHRPTKPVDVHANAGPGRDAERDSDANTYPNPHAGAWRSL